MGMDSVSFNPGTRELPADLWVQRGCSSLSWSHREGHPGEQELPDPGSSLQHACYLALGLPDAGLEAKN